MADEIVRFPAKITVYEDVSDIGLPQTTAVLEVDDEVATYPLPGGPEGDPGPRGIPVATWIRQDPPIANAGARPTGLTDDDIGKWWHRLDDDGMDTWTDIGWVHCANCVGDTGPTALPTFVEVSETNSIPEVRTAGMLITGTPTTLDAKVTVPSGPKGIQGVPGPSTEILTRTDFDTTVGPVDNAMFGWKNRSNIVQLSKQGKFRMLPFPNGYGPWTKYGSDFVADVAVASVDTIDLVSITLPALPFWWRPQVRGMVHVIADTTAPIGNPVIYARLNSTRGKIVAAGGGLGKVAATFPIVFRPFFSEVSGFEKTGIYPHARLSPSSTACAIEPYEEATIYLRIERVYATENSNSQLGFTRTGNYAFPGPYIEVRAQPISL